MKINPSQSGETNLSFTDVGKSCQNLDFFNVANMPFITIHENEILEKISAFTIPQINRYFLQTVKTKIKGHS